MQRLAESRIVDAEMPATFEPRLDILPESQRRLWPELDAVPSEFVLYGGTGLALQLGHRTSEDFDFFSSSGFDPEALRARLSASDAGQPGGVREPRRPGEGGVFRRMDTLQRVEDPSRAAGSRVMVASLLDIG